MSRLKTMTLLVAALLLFFPTSSLTAQLAAGQPGAMPVRACVIDSALARRRGILTLWAQPSARLSDTTARAAVERALVMEMQEGFVLPVTLDLWPWPGTGSEKGAGMASLGGRLDVTVRDGRLASREWFVEPRPLFRRPLEQAIDRAAASDAFVAAAAGLPDGHADFRIRFVASATDSAYGVALFRTRLPYLEISGPAQRVSGPPPVWPKGTMGSNGYVDFEFVIGQLGVVVPGSIWVIDYIDSRFIASATKAVEAGTYSPATIMGCPVGQMVMQRVSFESR